MKPVQHEPLPDDSLKSADHIHAAAQFLALSSTLHAALLLRNGLGTVFGWHELHVLQLQTDKCVLPM